MQEQREILRYLVTRRKRSSHLVFFVYRNDIHCPCESVDTFSANLETSHLAHTPNILTPSFSLRQFWINNVRHQAQQSTENNLPGMQEGVCSQYESC